MIRPHARANVLWFVVAMTFVFLPGGVSAQPSGPVTQVAAGADFACALTTSGGVACWGKNNVGQLGNNSPATLTSNSPVDVFGLTSGVVAIASGSAHACALTTGGAVKCWGSDSLGQLGESPFVAVQRYAPVDVFGLTSNVVAIAAGDSHTCALTVIGGVKCWGRVIGVVNTASLVPYDVSGLTSGVSAIAAGGLETCALTLGGGMKCWGDNANGEIGDNSTALRPNPTDVSGLLSGVRSIDVGSGHACAVTTAGGAKCWGDNLHFQLGNGDFSGADQHVPVDVVGLASGIGAITAGAAHTCALTLDGYMKCWGGNANGQLGNGDPGPVRVDHPVSVDVVGLGNVVAAISAGGNHTCERSAGGNVRCWGDGSFGQLGTGAALPLSATPVGVNGLSASGVAQIGLGESHTCALTNAGGVKCWGFNSQGELGNNSATNSDSSTPVDVSGLTSGAMYLSASKFHTCAVTTGGGAKCWGQNTSGSLGTNDFLERHVPTDVVGLTSGIATVTTGSNHSCALDTLGNASCWGGNSLGVLGDGSYSQRLFPVGVHQPVGLAYIGISAGDTVTCALAFGGFVQCWGANNAGQLGGPSSPDPLKTNVPQNVPGLPDITVVDAGGSHNCVRTLGSGGLKCWGSNSSGELGDGTFTSPRTSPQDVPGLTSGFASIASGTVHTCALTMAGGVKCWGDNFFNQLGDGTGTGRPSPVDVVGLASGITAIEAGVAHTCAITTAGGVKCWGHNLNGQLGDSSTTNRPTPVIALIGGQSISFTPPPQLRPSVPVTLAATATSGLAVTFDTWTPFTCSIAGNTVTANLVGLCGIRASQAGNGNFSAAPQTLSLVPVSLTPVMVSAASRRAHSTAGTFDLPLSPVATNPTTEPRVGPAQTVVVTFDTTIASADNPTVSEGTATFSSMSFSGSDVILNFTGVIDQQYVTFALANVASTGGGTGGTGSVRVGFLFGDANQSRQVTVADVGIVNAALLQSVTNANFRLDVNADGKLTVADKGLTNANLLKKLPAP